MTIQESLFGPFSDGQQQIELQYLMHGRHLFLFDTVPCQLSFIYLTYATKYASYNWVRVIPIFKSVPNFQIRCIKILSKRRETVWLAPDGSTFT